jgi:hypothetical protein
MNGNNYFSAPLMCQSKGGLYNFVCEFHAFGVGRKSICLFRKEWKKIICGFKCPNKQWQEERSEITEGTAK